MGDVIFPSTLTEINICILEMGFNLSVQFSFPKMILFLFVVLIDFANCWYGPIPSPTGPRHGYLPRNESFRFHFDCTGWDIHKCDSAKTALAEVGELIATELLFYAPVVVCAKLSSVPVPPQQPIKSQDFASTTMRSMYSK